MVTGVEVPPEILALSVGTIAVVVKFLISTEMLTACSYINCTFLAKREDGFKIDAELVIIGAENGKILLVKVSDYL